VSFSAKQAVDEVEFFQFGATDGRLLFYFHGAPGSPMECRSFATLAKQRGVTLLCADRFCLQSGADKADRYELVAAAMVQIAAGRGFDVVGFSLGAYAAIQCCLHLPGQVQRLHLISAAAPLELGDFLPAMAGAKVFQLAQRHPRLFRALSRWQSLLARYCPGLLFRLLFASSQAADLALTGLPEFRQAITADVQRCFSTGLSGYSGEIQSYVQPWAGLLSRLELPCLIWHGAEDNWAPPAMAVALQQQIAGSRLQPLYPQQSHFSCLQLAMPQVIALSAQQNPA